MANGLRSFRLATKARPKSGCSIGLGGEAQKLTATPQDVNDFVWSPDSTRLALALRDPTDEELDAAKTNKDKSPDPSDAGKSKKPKTQKPWVIDRLQFKVDEVGYLDRRRTHLYTFTLAGKALTQITSGDYDDDEPAWSPDGKLIAFASNRSKPDPDATYNKDIWTVASDNSEKGGQSDASYDEPRRRFFTSMVARREVDRLLNAARSKVVPIRDKSTSRYHRLPAAPRKCSRSPSTAWRRNLGSRLTASPFTSLPTMTAPKCFARPIWRTAKFHVPYPAGSFFMLTRLRNPATLRRR